MRKQIIIAGLIGIVAISVLYFLWPQEPEPEPEWRLVKNIRLRKCRVALDRLETLYYANKVFEKTYQEFKCEYQ